MHNVTLQKCLETCKPYGTRHYSHSIIVIYPLYKIAPKFSNVWTSLSDDFLFGEDNQLDGAFGLMQDDEGMCPILVWELSLMGQAVTHVAIQTKP